MRGACVGARLATSPSPPRRSAGTGLSGNLSKEGGGEWLTGVGVNGRRATGWTHSQKEKLCFVLFLRKKIFFGF